MPNIVTVKGAGGKDTGRGAAAEKMAEKITGKRRVSPYAFDGLEVRHCAPAAERVRRVAGGGRQELELQLQGGHFGDGAALDPRWVVLFARAHCEGVARVRVSIKGSPEETKEMARGAGKTVVGGCVGEGGGGLTANSAVREAGG